MDSYNMADAKARLSELVDRATAGEDIQISRRGEPQVRLVPVDKPKKRVDVDALRRITEKQKARLLAEGKTPWAGAVSFVEWARQNDEI